MTAVLGSLLLLALGQGGLTVRGDSVCPTRREVERLVAALAPEVSEPLVATLASQGAELTVDLHGPSGALLARKRLTADNCTVLAEAAAVFIATWVQQSQLAGTDAPPPPEAVTTPASPGRAPVELALAASVVGGMPSGALALGASIDGVAHLRDRPWGLGLALVLGPLEVGDLEGGSFAVRRSVARVGPTVRVGWGPAVAELRGELVGGVLWLSGRGFDQNYTVLRLFPGLGGSARVGVQVGAFRPFVAAVGSWWPIAERVAVVDAPGTRALARFEVLLALGCAWQVL